MRKYSFLPIFTLLFLGIFAFSAVSGGSFSIDYDRGVFLLDNKPFNYHSGSIHYFRMHGNRWARRLQQMKEMGLNAIQYYIAWNYHETFEGQYNFDGDRNFTHFSELALQNGLYTIMRIGPYICAEWENGGFPYFVTSSNLTLRSMDSNYLAYVKKWMDVLLPKVKPMLYKNGGNVLMVQLENEFGLFQSSDKTYLKWLRDLVISHLGSDVVLYTTDPFNVVQYGMVDGALPTMDFGPHTEEQIQQRLAQLRALVPGNKGPLVNSEFWTGWIVTWNETAEDIKDDIPTDDEIVSTIKIMLKLNMSFNIYMVFGGTNLGYWNGAHPNEPVLTSYDYGAPIGEDGTEKDVFFGIAKVLGGVGANRVPKPEPTFGGFKVDLVQVATMEGVIQTARLNPCKYTTFSQCRQPYGLLCYNLNPMEMDLSISGYSYFYSDGSLLCVENYGRVNSPAVNSEWGILKGSVSATYILDDSFILLAARREALVGSSGSGIYRGNFTVPSQFRSNAAGTHLSFANWGKGILFINGNNMGRYWSVGPQISLYVDGYFLDPNGVNEVLFLELLDVNRGCSSTKSCYVNASSTAIWTQPLRN